MNDQAQIRFLQALPILSLQLGKQHIDIGALQVHRHHTAGSLAGFHQILGQLLQPLALAVQHLQVFLRLGVMDLLFFQ